MKEEKYSNPELKAADELVEKGEKAFLSFSWKLDKKCDDSFDSSETNPYSDDSWANVISYPEYDLELAFDYYQQALARYEKILEPDDIKIGETLFNCGTICMDPIYNDVIALDYFKKALPIYLKKKPYSRDLAILYEDLGSVCFSTNDLLSSLDYYYKSLSLFNKLAICGEEEDTSELKGRITEAENKLGLHIVHEGNKCGFADKDGSIVIPCIWNDVSDFSEGFCCVKDDKDLYGYINYHGEIVIPCIYKEASSFKDGMAQVEENINDKPDDFFYSIYIDNENNHIGCDYELRPSHIKAVYNARVLALFGKYKEAAECILPATNTMDTDPVERLLVYYIMAKQYDEIIKWCNKIEIVQGHFDSLLPWARQLLGQCYEEGLGVERDLLQAFHWYDMACLTYFSTGYNYDKRDAFLKRHPEMLELPEVQRALARHEEDDEEEY